MNDKFERLYQQDRYHIKKWEKNYSNEEFYKIHKKMENELNSLPKKKLTPRQKFICAMIYHHAFTKESSKKALKYIQEAQEEGYQRQKWLVASIRDRLLQLQRKPQKYGTQIIELKNGKFKQYKTDNSISDEERIKLGLPKLKNLKKYLED
jgi:hypothetical protein